MSDFDERAAAARDAAGPLGAVTTLALREWFAHSGGKRAFTRFANGYDLLPKQRKSRPRYGKLTDVRRARAERALHLYMNEGWTLDQIGVSFGLTRERVRQDMESFVGVLYQWTRRHRTKKREWLKAEATRNACYVCGAAVYGNHVGYRRFCSAEHYKAWQILRYQLADDDERVAHRASVHSWIMRHPDHPGVSMQHVENVRNGTNERRGEGWITRGSVAEAIAIEAYRRGWPVFDLLRPAVQQQIKDRLNPPPPPRPRDPDARHYVTKAEVELRREIVALMREEGRSGKTIAEYLNVPIRTVYNDMFYLHHGHN